MIEKAEQIGRGLDIERKEKREEERGKRKIENYGNDNRFNNNNNFNKGNNNQIAPWKRSRFQQSNRQQQPIWQANVGKPNANVCRKCGKNHGTRPCASGTNSCFKCGKPGHIALECRQKQVQCYNCEEMGRVSPNCPIKKEAGKIATAT